MGSSDSSTEGGTEEELEGIERVDVEDVIDTEDVAFDESDEIGDSCAEDAEEEGLGDTERHPDERNEDAEFHTYRPHSETVLTKSW
jgi:hypothetical protein